MSVITGERGGKGVSFEEEEKKGVLRVLQGGCHFGWKFFMDLLGITKILGIIIFRRSLKIIIIKNRLN